VNADRSELRQRITDAVLQLPERERLVLGLRYHQELRPAEIAEIIGVTESRVSQLHAKAVLQLRALLPDELEPALG
jgi:RNA polymerase sigma factor FliA